MNITLTTTGLRDHWILVNKWINTRARAHTHTARSAHVRAPPRCIAALPRNLGALFAFDKINNMQCYRQILEERKLMKGNIFPSRAHGKHTRYFLRAGRYSPRIRNVNLLHNKWRRRWIQNFPPSRNIFRRSSSTYDASAKCASCLRRDVFGEDVGKIWGDNLSTSIVTVYLCKKHCNSKLITSYRLRIMLRRRICDEERMISSFFLMIKRLSHFLFHAVFHLAALSS